ncbi:hypothetical protein LEP3755_34130 [Leptolyngbya sp. NIES-3755]|nr:hypothetical protein LEP3755_34130 [Leptolyngbya sp. NIES-3755]
MNLIRKIAQLESRLSRIDIRLGINSYNLTFQVPNGAITVDPETGLEQISLVPYTIECYLEQSKSQTRQLENIEVEGFNNAASILMEGFVISPSLLPQYIRPLMIATLQVNDADYSLKGKFLLLPSLNSSDSIANHTVKGYAQFNPGGLT